MSDPVGRRRFLSNMSLALSGLAGAVVSVPILAYLLSPLINPIRGLWRDLTPVDRLAIGETQKFTIEEPSPLPWAGQTARTALWLRRVAENEFRAFALNCTHLGCPVSWQREAQLFLCPCHGGVYYADGRVAGGPPPRPLSEYQVRVQGGTVQVLTRGLQFH